MPFPFDNCIRHNLSLKGFKPIVSVSIATDFVNFTLEGKSFLYSLIFITFHLAKIAVPLLEKTPLKLLTNDQLLLFKENNILSDIDKNFSDLGIQSIDTKIVIKILLDKIFLLEN